MSQLTSVEPDKFNCTTFACDISYLLYVILHILLHKSTSASNDQMMENSIIQVFSVVKLFIQSKVLYSLLTEVQILFLYQHMNS